MSQQMIKHQGLDQRWPSETAHRPRVYLIIRLNFYDISVWWWGPSPAGGRVTGNRADGSSRFSRLIHQSWQFSHANCIQEQFQHSGVLGCVRKDVVNSSYTRTKTGFTRQPHLENSVRSNPGNKV